MKAVKEKRMQECSFCLPFCSPFCRKNEDNIGPYLPYKADENINVWEISQALPGRNCLPFPHIWYAMSTVLLSQLSSLPHPPPPNLYHFYLRNWTEWCYWPQPWKLGLKLIQKEVCESCEQQSVKEKTQTDPEKTENFTTSWKREQEFPIHCLDLNTFRLPCLGQRGMKKMTDTHTEEPYRKAGVRWVVCSNESEAAAWNLSCIVLHRGMRRSTLSRGSP